jgi:hypothetical protein
VFIAINALLVFFGTAPFIAALPWVLAGATFGLFFNVYRTQQELWRVDMAAKSGQAVQPPPPTTRHRRTFVTALILATAGIWLATMTTREVAVHVASLILLAVAAGLFVISLRDFRRFRAQRRFFLTAFLRYMPYLLVGALLLAGLRVWFVLAPHGVDFPPVKPTPSELAGFPTHPAYVACRVHPYWEDHLPLPDYLAIEDRYRGFINIDPLVDPAGHADAFALFFAAYTSRCVVDHHMMTYHLLDRPDAWQSLDPAEKREALRLIRLFSDDAVFIRLFFGAGYFKLHRDAMSEGSPLPALIDDNLEYLSAFLPATFWDSLRWRFRP